MPPLVLFIAVLLVMPSLTVAANRWRLACGGIAAVIVLTVITGFTLGCINRHRVLAALPPATADLPDPALMQAGSAWPAYGGSFRARRFRRLTQLTPDNVWQLERAWLV